MVQELIPINDWERFHGAGPNDFIQLAPIGCAPPLFYSKVVFYLIGECMVRGMYCHVSGPTGSGKTSLLEAMYLEPKNWQAMCKALSVTARPLRVYEIESVDFESPGELRQRRALQNGSTYDEESKLVTALREAAARKATEYSVIYFKEIGRVHSAMVQNGLLNLMRDDIVLLPNGERVDVSDVAFVADLGNVSSDDVKMARGLFNQVFGIKVGDEKDPTLGGVF